MKASDYIANCISKQGVQYVFGYQGGNIAHIIDSIWRHKDIEFVSTYNEQGAAFAACGYALENETIGVALASSGPGAINLISGIANAFFDSIPCLFITGNVSASTMKRSEEVRQNAFQENDIVAMVSKVTKYAVTVTEPSELRYHLEKAIYLAKEGRPGAVLLDLPHNVQKTNLDFEKEKGFEHREYEPRVLPETMRDIIDIFSASSRPVIIVGGGLQKSKSRKLINQFLDRWNIPVVSTLRGLDIISHLRENFVGFGGAYGNRSANYALKYADAVLVLGARLDERFLNTGDRGMLSRKKMVHVDIDTVELGRVIPTEKKVESSVESFLEALLDADIPALDFRNWIETIQLWDKRYPSVGLGWSINRAVYELTSRALEDAVISLDIGINQMCAAQSMNLNGFRHCYTSAGHGAMGCSLPIAIGAVYAGKGKAADCFVGDGALHMNIQELLMLAKNNLPVHVILNNNHCLGMIRDFQTKAFESRFAATVDELQEVDYENIAKAYKLKYCKISSLQELDTAVGMIRSKEPCFIELVFPEDSDTNPKLGTDMFNQFPRLSENEVGQIEKEAMDCGNIIF